MNEWSGHLAGMASEEMEQPYADPGAATRGASTCWCSTRSTARRTSTSTSPSAASSRSCARRPTGGSGRDVAERTSCSPGPRRSPPAMRSTARPTHARADRRRRASPCFTLDPDLGEFVLTQPNVAGAGRHAGVRDQQLQRALLGAAGQALCRRVPGRQARAARQGLQHALDRLLVAEAHRILMRGGVFLYPRDTKDPAQAGPAAPAVRGQPVGFVIEQAGGRASTGRQPRARRRSRRELHQRIGLVFGSKNEVERIERYHREPAASEAPAPLFADAQPVPRSEPRGPRHVRETPHHRHHRLVRRRHHLGDAHLREHLPPREASTAAVIEGDSFHRFDRKEMKQRHGRGASSSGNQHFSHFGPETNLFAELEAAVPQLRRDRHRQAPQVPARRRGGRAVRAGAGHLHALGDAAGRAPTCCSTRACTAPSSRAEVNVAQLRRPADRRRAGDQPGVDPEAAPRQERARLLAPRR